MRRTRTWLFILPLLFCGAVWAVEDEMVKQADSLLNSGRPAEAYALLEPYQSERAGDTDYDYRLGIAALDSGRPNEAIFALERVLAIRPGHLQARAEIARAYLATGETAASRREFETVKQQQIPGEVSATIQKFLDAIEQATAGERTTMSAYLEAVLGGDSNVNSATGNRQVAIPALGGVIATLSANGVKQGDGFANVAGGFNLRHPFSPRWAMFSGANFNQRINASHGNFDTQALDGNLGASLTSGNDIFSTALQLQTFRVDNNRYRDTTGLTAQWQRTLDNGSQFSTYLQYAELRYPGQKVRNADRTVLGAGYARALGGARAPIVYVGAYGGKEAEKAANVPYLGHRVAGARVGGEIKLGAGSKLFGSASLELRNYGGQEPLFLVSRKDKQADLRAGINYTLAKDWSVVPQLAYTRNDSNVVINDYNRAVFSVSVRRNFN